MSAYLKAYLGRDEREEIRVLVTVRWFLAAAAAFVVDYRHGTLMTDWIVLNALLLAALVVNAAMHLALRRDRPIPRWLPLGAGAYDLAAISAAIAAVDGFANNTFILYYPALLAFTLAFSGRPSSVAALLSIAAYVAVVNLQHTENIDLRSVADQKNLVLRVAAMVAVVIAANQVTDVERRLRRMAVARETERLQQVNALRERARELESAAESERRHLQREIHDGVSQGVFMLSLGLEGIAKVADSQDPGSELGRRLHALQGVAKSTLLETRGLLFDLSRVMSGEVLVSRLVQHQASEFQAVTGIAVDVAIVGEETPLPASVVGEVYRVLQEGLANVFRHASAKEVTLTVEYASGIVVVEVRDDGIGFDRGTGRSRMGHGLWTMEQRAEHLDGSLEVESAPGAGTKLRLIIPREGSE